MTKKSITVASYIAQQIAICGKSQIVISNEIGYENPNVLTMFKQGKTKLPITKVKQLAASLCVDPLHLLKLTMMEYMPESWAVIEDIIGNSPVSESEMHILGIVRRGDNGLPVEPVTTQEKEELELLVAKWVKRHKDNYDAKVKTKVL
jgi:hypothetical protein